MSYLFGVVFLFLSSAVAGQHQAILATDPDQGFQLSESAIKTIEVTGVFVRSFGTKAPYVIPKKCLVSYQEHIGVYRMRKNWFKLIPIQEIEPSDQIACSGLGLLRVADLEAFGEKGETHD